MRHRAAVFVLNKANVLLFHRFKNGNEYYAVPGGGVEFGETSEEAAVRELKEETSLDIVLGDKIGELEEDGNRQYFFLAKSWTGTPALGGPEAERNSPNNLYRLEWVPIEDLGKIYLRDDIRDVLVRHLSPIAHYLGSALTATIDRPLGSKHPKWGFEYPVNYGFIPNTKSGDGEEIDAYVLGVGERLKKFTGKCIAIIHRLDDDDDKLVLVPDGVNFSDEEIRKYTEFQEKFFKSVIVR